MKLGLVALLLVSAVSHGKTITVAPDGSGDFKSVQAAIDAAPSKSTDRTVIHIKPGRYKERVRVPRDKPNLVLRGDDARTTLLSYDLSAQKILPPATQPVGTSGSYSTLIEAPDFLAENLTFANTAGDVGQAVALRTTGERQAFIKCRMTGWQDTLYVHTGTAYFRECYIEGRVDFIFGRATALFDRCHVHSKNGGFVTAAATEATQPFGYVFLDCKLTGDGAKAYLGRPWRDNAAVAFIRCKIGDHIRPEGWHNWDNPAREQTARFIEIANSGPGANTSRRVKWAKLLDEKEAATFTIATVLPGWDVTKLAAVAASDKSRIVLAGDSTVTNESGWGTGFAERMGGSADVINLAKGGRSSKSYRDEGWWKQVLEAKPDYVLIQFGHNDQPGKGPERETDPKTTFRENLSRYVREARAAGAKPILITSLERRKFDAAGEKIIPSLSAYADATRKVAADENVPLIDLHASSIALYEKLKPAGCERISPRKDGAVDSTHLNAEGGKMIGALVADAFAAARTEGPATRPSSRSSRVPAPP
jgi:pectinesterase